MPGPGKRPKSRPRRTVSRLRRIPKERIPAGLKEAVEELEYQQKNAQDLVQDAIGKLSLVAGDPEQQALSDRLQAAITRISGLPTEEQWNASQAEQGIRGSCHEAGRAAGTGTAEPAALLLKQREIQVEQHGILRTRRQTG